MTVRVSEQFVIGVDEPAKGVLDRLQHVVDIKRRTIVVERHVNLHLAVQRRRTGRPPAGGRSPDEGFPPLDACAPPGLHGDGHPQHHAIPGELDHKQECSCATPSGRAAVSAPGRAGSWSRAGAAVSDLLAKPVAAGGHDDQVAAACSERGSTQTITTTTCGFPGGSAG